MKRLFALLMILTLVLTLFCACTPKKEATEEKPSDVKTPELVDPDGLKPSENESADGSERGESDADQPTEEEETAFTLPGSPEDPYELPIIPLTPTQPGTTTGTTEPAPQPTQGTTTPTTPPVTTEPIGPTNPPEIETEENELPIVTFAP